MGILDKTPFRFDGVPLKAFDTLLNILPKNRVSSLLFRLYLQGHRGEVLECINRACPQDHFYLRGSPSLRQREASQHILPSLKSLELRASL